MDKLSPEQRRKCMQHNCRKDTSPELVVRKALRDSGHTGYRLQWKVQGRPDIAYPGRKLAVFINGCFWHRCPKCHPSMPESNVEFWKDKFANNVSRDAENYRILEESGWTVVVIWECEIKKDLDGALKRITIHLKDR